MAASGSSDVDMPVGVGRLPVRAVGPSPPQPARTTAVTTATAPPARRSDPARTTDWTSGAAFGFRQARRSMRSAYCPNRAHAAFQAGSTERRGARSAVRCASHFRLLRRLTSVTTATTETVIELMSMKALLMSERDDYVADVHDVDHTRSSVSPWLDSGALRGWCRARFVVLPPLGWSGCRQLRCLRLDAVGDRLHVLDDPGVGADPERQGVAE